MQATFKNGKKAGRLFLPKIMYSFTVSENKVPSVALEAVNIIATSPGIESGLIKAKPEMLSVTFIILHLPSKEVGAGPQLSCFVQES